MTAAALGLEPATVPVRAAHAGPVLVGALIGSLIAGRWETAVLALAIATFAAARVGARLPPRRWMVTLASGVALAIAMNLYLTPGTAWTALPVLFGHPATREGGIGGIGVVLRMAGALAATQGLRAMLPGERGADAVARALAPLEKVGVPVGELRVVLGLTARTLPLLREETERVGRVQRLRAGGPPRGWDGRMRALRAATVPAMVGALERADRVALALEARHYRLRPLAPRSGGRGSAFGWSVALALVVVCALWRA
jgi:energy-coupling factor transport system permease protein